MLLGYIISLSLITSGIYLFHRIQYYDNKSTVDTDGFVSLVFGSISIVLLNVPILIGEVYYTLFYIPLLILIFFVSPLFSIFTIMLAYLFYIFYFQLYTSFLVLLTICIIITFIFKKYMKTNLYFFLPGINFLLTTIHLIMDYSLFQTQVTFPLLMYVLLSTFIMLIATLTFLDTREILKLIHRYESEEYTDYLTGLGNTKQMEECAHEWAESSTSMSMYLIDIDNFKVVNDLYGYQKGDHIIVEVSKILEKHVPSGGQLFRNAGEEFAMVIPNLNFDQTVRLAEGIRNGIERDNFLSLEDNTMNITVSIGIGYNEKILSVGKLFKEADDMLHAAKKQGQNRVMFNPLL